jgi:NADH-quinone oxidoreductase subunit N
MNAIIFSAVAGIIMMFGGIITKNKSYLVNIARIILAVLIIVNILDTYGVASIVIDSKSLLSFNKFGLFFNTICYSATFIYFLLSGDAVAKAGNYVAEYFALIFFSLCGIAVLTAYNDLLMLFIGIEIMSIPLYILTSADKKNLKSNEASLKYFLMGCFSTGILLMGITLVYGAVGNFHLPPLSSAVTGNPTANTNANSIIEPLGLILIFVALAFKVSAAPFHFWTPDVYDGAPSVFTSFMATIIKAAGFFAFIKLFEWRSATLGISWRIIVSVIILATLLVGNITAVFQQSVKRMLAYSSIAQAGFMLFALYKVNDLSKEALLLYTTAYSLATIGIFAILIKIKDYTFEGYNGLAKKYPLLAAVNTICLLSLAGIPLTAGFFGKYFMLAAAFKAGTSILFLVIIAVLFAAVSVYYYFRVIQAMYFKEGDAEVAEVGIGFKTGLITVAVLIIAIGIMPSIILNWFYF